MFFLAVLGTNNMMAGSGDVFCGMMRAVALYSQSPGAGINICGPYATY